MKDLFPANFPVISVDKDSRTVGDTGFYSVSSLFVFKFWRLFGR